MIFKGVEDVANVSGTFIVSTILAILFGGIATGKTDELNLYKMKNLTTNITLVGTMLMLYYFGNEKRTKPAAVIAGIPIGSVQELSHALSDRELKFRATGGVFLAHQGGGSESLRIICKAFGKNRYLFLMLIDFLFLYGNARVIDMFEGLNPTASVGSGFSRITEDLFKEKSLTPNPWKSFKKFAADEGREEYHLTFPIVTKNRVYTSMYIETYDIIESVESGMNMLTISLFFRKWVVPYSYEFVKITGAGELSDTVWYKQTNDKTVQKLRFIDAILDIGLSIVIQTHRLLNYIEHFPYEEEQIIALTLAKGLNKSGPSAYRTEGNKSKEEDYKVDNSELIAFNPGSLNFAETLLGLF